MTGILCLQVYLGRGGNSFLNLTKHLGTDYYIELMSFQVRNTSSEFGGWHKRIIWIYMSAFLLFC